MLKTSEFIELNRNKVIKAIAAGILSNALICAKTLMDSFVFAQTIDSLIRDGILSGSDRCYVLS